MRKPSSLLFIILFAVGCTVQAASFTPVQEMTYCNSDALTRADIPEPNEFTDRYDLWHPNFNDTFSSTYIDIPPDGYVQAESDSAIEIYIETDGMEYTDNMIQVLASSYSYAEIYSPDGEEAYAWAGAEMVAPGTATGNFYEITPEAGESTGDWVTVTIDYSAMIWTETEGGSSNTALLHGPEQQDILITRNCADFDDPQPSEIVHTISMQDSDGEYDDQATFSAQVGDVIGIHCGVYTNAYAGEDLAWADSSAEVYLGLVLSEGTGPELTAADADIDGSGFVDLGDLAILAQFWLQYAPAANDDCGNAIALSLGVPVEGNNYGATGGSMDECSLGNDIKDVWYSFTAPSSNWYRILVSMDDPDEFDSALSIWDACDGEHLECQENYGDEEIQWYINQDETIYIRVAGYEGPFPDEGEFTIVVEPLLQ